MRAAMSKAKQLVAGKGYDADWFRAALAKRRLHSFKSQPQNRNPP
jgi:hypothetical protein